MRPGRAVQVVDYRPEWVDQFSLLRDRLWLAVGETAIGIEHVGSTSVAGLAAKPVIDLDIVIPSALELALTVEQLKPLGYRHAGNLGIVDREAFLNEDDRPAHNLYVCPRESIALRNHIAFRDHLRTHPENAAAYAALKKQLAQRFPDDIDSYAEAKTDFVLAILAQYGLSADRLGAVQQANQDATSRSQPEKA